MVHGIRTLAFILVLTLGWSSLAAASSNPRTDTSFPYADLNADDDEPDTDELPRASCCTRLMQFCKQKLGWYLTFGGICAAAGGVFYDHYSQKIKGGVKEDWAISDGCTSVIQEVGVLTVGLTAARLSMAYVGSTRLGAWLHLARRATWHKLAGVLFLGSAAVHTYYSQDTKEKLSRVSGWGMWGGIGLVGLSFAVKDLPFLRQRLGYNLLFLAPHRLGAGVFLLGYFIHRPSLPFYAWLSIPVIILASDRCLELYRYSHASCLVSDPLVCGKSGVTTPANGEEARCIRELSKAKLELLQPQSMQVQAGQMVYANLRGRPHPLTVAKVDNRQISLIVGGAGVGTKRLLAAIDDKSLKKSDSVTLTGPYATQLQSLRFGKAPLVAVSGGAGMSVTGAVLDRLASSDHQVPAVFLLHSDRDTQSFELLLEEAAVAKEHGVPVQRVHLFLTGKNADDAEAAHLSELRRTIARLGMHLVEDEAVSSQNQRIQVHVHRGRINARSLKRSKTMQAGSFVVMAGNPDLVNDLSAFCTKYGLRYHAEDFQ